MTTIDRSRLPNRSAGGGASARSSAGRSTDERSPSSRSPLALGPRRRSATPEDSAVGGDSDTGAGVAPGGSGRRLATSRRTRRTESGWQLVAMLSLVGVGALQLFAALRRPEDGMIVLAALPVLVGAGLGIVHLLVRATRPSFDLAGIAITGLSLRFLGGYVRFSNPVDASVYHKEGMRLAASYRLLDFSVDPGREIPGTGTIRVASGLLHIVTLDDFYLTLLVFTLGSFAGACLFVRALQVGFPDADLKRYAMLVFFLPTLFFWPSSLGKEAWMLLGLGLAALGAAHLYAGATGRGLAYLALGLTVTALVRPHVSILTVAAVGVGLLGTGTGNTRVRSAARVVGVVLLLLGGAVLSRAAQERLSLENLGTEEVSSARDRTVESTSEGGSAFTPIVANDPLTYGGAALTVLLRPLPGELRSVEGLLASAESVFIVGVFVASWRRFRGFWGRLRHVRYLLMSVAFVLGFIWAFSAIGNFGILTRQRSQVLPFLFVVAALPAVERVARPRRRDRLGTRSAPSRSPTPTRNPVLAGKAVQKRAGSPSRTGLP